MSIRELFSRNYNTLHAQKLIADELDIGIMVIDTINATNANVENLYGINATIQTTNTDTINSTTANLVNVSSSDITTDTFTTTDLTATNGTITDLTATNGTIDDLVVNNALTVPVLNAPTINTTNLNTTNLTATNGTINGLNVLTNLTAPTITSNDITSINANLDNIVGNSLQYNTGNISDLTGSNLTYDTGFIAAASTNELTVYSAIVSCPNANIDNLTVNSTFTAPLFEAPEMHVDYVRSYSVGKTTFQEKVVVDTQFNCPIVSANTLQTNGSGSVNVINDMFGTNLTLSGVLKVNNLQTVTGLGNINSVNNIIAPTHVATTSVNTPVIINGVLPVAASTGVTFPNTNGAGTTNLRYYLQSTGSLTTSGAVVTSLSYRATRIGGQVNVCVQAMDSSVLATSNAFLTISGLPSDFLPNGTTCCGPILTNTATGITLGRYQFNGSGDLLIFASLSGAIFATGSPCGLFGGTAQFATFTFSRTT